MNIVKYNPSYCIKASDIATGKNPGGRLLRRSRMKKKAAKWNSRMAQLAEYANRKMMQFIEDSVCRAALGLRVIGNMDTSQYSLREMWPEQEIDYPDVPDRFNKPIRLDLMPPFIAIPPSSFLVTSYA